MKKRYATKTVDKDFKKIIELTEYKQTDFNRMQHFPKDCSCIDSIDHHKTTNYN